MRALSVVIITFNEERNLGRCLASVQGVADEVVVVDSYSTDGTEAIARRYGARFVQHAFAGHIAQKNWAITQASNPFVLSLDADEALDERLRTNILRAKSGRADGHTMNRLTNYCGSWIRHGGWYPDRKLRLWDSRKGHWTGIDPHDRFEMQSGSNIEHLEGDILHYSYYSLSDHYEQVEYFTTIAAKALAAKGKRATLVKLWLSPIAKFVGAYFFQLGILDGRHGFTIARISAWATHLKYAKLRALQGA